MKQLIFLLIIMWSSTAFGANGISGLEVDEGGVVLETTNVHADSGGSIGITDDTSGSGVTDGLMLQQTGLDSFIYNWEDGDMFFGVNGATDMTLLDGGNFGIGEDAPEGKLHVNTTGYDEGIILEIPAIAALPNAGYTQLPPMTWQGGEEKFGKWRQFFNGYEMGWGLSYNTKWNYEDNTWSGRDVGDDRTNMCAMLRFNVAEGNVGGELLELNFAQGASAEVVPDWNSSSDYFFYAASIDNAAPTMFHMRAPGNSDVTIRMAPDEGGDPTRVQLRNAADNNFYIESLEQGSTSYANPFSQRTEPIIAIDVEERNVGIGHASPTADVDIRGNSSVELPNTCSSSGTTVTSTAHGQWALDVLSLPSGDNGTEETFIITAVTNANTMIIDSVPTNAVSGVVCHTDSDLLNIDDAEGREKFNINKRGLVTFDGDLKMIAETIYLADDGAFSIETGVNGTGAAITYHGFGWLIVGDADEYAQFWVNATGGVILVGNTADIVANADTDGKFCINIAGDPAEPVYLKNRLGSATQVSYVFWYN